MRFTENYIKKETDALNFILLKMKKGVALNMSIDFGIFKEAKRYVILRTK